MQPNRPTKFRRPETTLGGMLILRHRSAAAFLHSQDPKATYELSPEVMKNGWSTAVTLRGRVLQRDRFLRRQGRRPLRLVSGRGRAAGASLRDSHTLPGTDTSPHVASLRAWRVGCGKASLEASRQCLECLAGEFECARRLTLGRSGGRFCLNHGW